MLSIDPFYADNTLIVLYNGIALPSGVQADNSCSVELDFRRSEPLDVCELPDPVAISAPVSVSNGQATTSLVLPALTLKRGLYRWRTVLVDSSDNRLPLDKGEVKVEDF